MSEQEGVSENKVFPKDDGDGYVFASYCVEDQFQVTALKVNLWNITEAWDGVNEKQTGLGEFEGDGEITNAVDREGWSLGTILINACSIDGI